MSVAQQALKDLGIPVDAYYASEIDPYAIAVTAANHPETMQLGSVTDVETATEQNIDLMIGGSPCQDLSIAKKGREGLSGKRSGLFWEYVRIRDEVKPKYFVLENVASMPKEAKDTISEALGVEPVMINASLVSAQNRKRLFWIGKFDGWKYQQVEIQQPEDKGIMLKDILEENVDEKFYLPKDTHVKWINKGLSRDGKAKAMSASMHKGIGNDGTTLVVGTLDQGTWAKRYEQIRRVYGGNGKAPTIPTGTGGGVIPKIDAEPVALRNRGQGKKPEYNGTGKANAMTSVQTDSMVAVENHIRKLTPTECLRLQSMPDTYFDKAEYKGKPISNTQRYKMCGNAFNCEVIKHIIKQII